MNKAGFFFAGLLCGTILAIGLFILGSIGSTKEDPWCPSVDLVRKQAESLRPGRQSIEYSHDDIGILGTDILVEAFNQVPPRSHYWSELIDFILITDTVGELFVLISVRDGCHHKHAMIDRSIYDAFLAEIKKSKQP